MSKRSPDLQDSIKICETFYISNSLKVKILTSIVSFEAINGLYTCYWSHDNIIAKIYITLVLFCTS